MRVISNAGPIKARNSRHPAAHPPPLGGSVVALVTPFAEGQVDAAALAALCDRQIRRGSAALVVCGSTGEAIALASAEHARVVAVAVEAAASRVPVIAGCGALATEDSAALAAKSVRHGASAVLCAPPPYSRPTQEGIFAHVRVVAHAADAPVILYDVPSRVGVAITDETVARLFESGLVVAIKDAAGDLSRPARLRASCGQDLIQFTGDDATAPAYRAMGGHGCISVTANVVPSLCARMQAAWDRADLIEVARLRDLLAPLHQALFRESNPIPIKAALHRMGLCSDRMRLPLTRASGATIDALAALLPEVMRAEDDSAGLPHMVLVN